MRLSIVTINFNNAEGLRKTLASVATQTYRDIEHIIIDGGSTDGSVDAIKEYVSANPNRDPFFKHTINWVSEKDNGIYNAMNKGIEIALGRRIVNPFNRSEQSGAENKVLPDYIQILNSGDILAASDVTEWMIKAVEEVEYPGIMYGNMLRDYGNDKLSKDICLGDRVNSRDSRAQEVEWTMDDFIKGTVNHDPTYIRADLYQKYGLYDENLKIVSDWKWFVNAVVFGGEKLYYVPIDVTIFDTTGISETNLADREAERRSELEKMLPAAILKDYDRYHFPIEQHKRLKKHHMWGLVYFIERVFFKLEKWHILK